MLWISLCFATRSRWRPRLLLRIAAGVVTTVLLAAALTMPIVAHDEIVVPIYKNDERVLDRQAYLIEGYTYVPFRAFCEMQGYDTVEWDAAARCARTLLPDGTVLEVYADGANYLRYGERYFYTFAPTRLINDRIYIPIRALAKCFALTVEWQAATRSITLTGTGDTVRSDVGVYAGDDLYWLARIIQAEAGGEEMNGKIAVGNVVLNRVRSDEFPSTVYGVIFDRTYGVQFSPTVNGSIHQEPSEESVIAARICLEGYTLSDKILYFFNPALAYSFWISEHRSFAFRIGNHVFYR